MSSLAISCGGRPLEQRLVVRLRHHSLTQYTTVGFVQAADRRQHSASGVSPRNRPCAANSRRAATENASFNRLIVLCRCSAACRDDAVVVMTRPSESRATENGKLFRDDSWRGEAATKSSMGPRPVGTQPRAGILILIHISGAERTHCAVLTLLGSDWRSSPGEPPVWPLN